jgi:hypothetical protein
MLTVYTVEGLKMDFQPSGTRTYYMAAERIIWWVPVGVVRCSVYRD